MLLLQLIKQLFATSGMDIADQPAGNAKEFRTVECAGNCGSQRDTTVQSLASVSCALRREFL